MRPQIPAIGLLLTAILLGIIGYGLTYGQYPGINVFLFTILILAAIIGWARYARLTLSIRRLWLIIPILFFALMWAVRANEDLRFASLLAWLSLLMLLVHYLRHERYVDQTSTLDQVAAGLLTGLMVCLNAVLVLGGSAKWFSQSQTSDLGRFKSVFTGLALALPILIVFGVLFSSADLVFADQFNNVFDILLPDELPSIVSRLAVTAAIAWVSGGLLHVALVQTDVVRIQTVVRIQAEAIESAHRQDLTASKIGFSLNMTESGIVLGGVATLFAVFVIIQFTYLFGGRSIIGEDYTFSEYARRGFFELVGVAVMVLGLVWVLDQITRRHTAERNRIFRGLSVLLILETLVILASAWRRMALYEDAYGFTELRVNTHVFMIWLAILLGVNVLSLFRIRQHVFSLGLLLVVIGYLGTINLINVDRIIANRNIERYYAGQELDLCYLTSLSVDALPPLVELYETSSDPNVIARLNDYFDDQQNRLSRHYDTYFALAEYHVSFRHAWRTLKQLERKHTVMTDWSCTQTLNDG